MLQRGEQLRHFVLIIGGRYGSEASDGNKKPDKTFFDRYDSITKKEYEEANRKNIPTYILIESSVYSEYHTYIRNKDNKEINYAYVDSVNIFNLIEDILSKPKNNPVHTFEKFSDIEFWLREQWSGLVREFLSKMSNQEQIRALSTQVADLKEINNTLKTYLESLMSKISPEDSPALIKLEGDRLQELDKQNLVRDNRWTRHVLLMSDIKIEYYIDAMKEENSFDNFVHLIGKYSNNTDESSHLKDLLTNNDSARSAFNQVRKILGLPIFRKRKSRQ